MSGHTPGPWTVQSEPDIHGHSDLVVMGHGYYLATLHDINDGSSEDIGNARLIAAAPTLLAACEAMLSGLRAARDERPDAWYAVVSPDIADAWVSMRTAIKKAKGELA